MFFFLKRNDSSRDVGKKKRLKNKKNDSIRLSNGRTFYIGLCSTFTEKKKSFTSQIQIYRAEGAQSG